ncbi:MAG: cbb3-type cytochrome c oxidase subunit I [Desulfobulbaceae bacterium]|nr:cbb3-type cytochrome c oxidase subunit I [Desulfobulbaceae bacterium]
MNPSAEKNRQRFTRTWQTPPGIAGWIAEVNNRPLGIRYMVTSLAFFLVAVVLAMVMRTQLAVPDNNLLTPDTYNRVFTMHGSTMLYLFAVPFIEGLGLYLIPLFIGSRDVAFPRFTNFGYWMYLFGGLTMYASIFTGQVPDAGWTAYTPLSGPRFSDMGLDFWLLGLSMVEIGGIGAAVEIVVTILKLRTPGMGIQHMPILVWSYLAAGVMILFGFTPLLLATLLLELERSLGFRFFDVHAGGNSLLWQHLFWFFGHPEVYIIFLPATGVLSTIIPVLTGRRLVAYNLVIVAIMVTAFVSFGLWTHHMFTAGLPDLPMLFFTAASFMIALASGIQVFAWIATFWGSRPPYTVPMLFILGFFFVFVNGGLTGVMVATMPFDWQVHDTNFVVAHFHHVLIGGAVFPFLAGMYHWLPKFSGRLAGEKCGRIGFGLIFIGFNFTFVPMYIIGLLGMRRRVFTYPEELGVGTLNFISTLGAYSLGSGFAVVLLGLIWSAWRGRLAADNPWNGATLEWSTPSPPHASGFQRPPVARDRYPLWLEPPQDALQSELTRAADGLDHRPVSWRATLVTDVTNGIPQAVQYLPGSTLLPFFTAVAILGVFISVLLKNFIAAIALTLLVLGLFGRWLTIDPDLPREEADAFAERMQLPLLSSGTRTVGWWGMLGMIAILFTVLAALIYGYFYLRLYSDEWPQMGLPLPGLAGSLPAYGLLVASGVVQFFNMRARMRGDRRFLLRGMAAVVILGAAFTSGELWNLANMPFSPKTNAYGSIFFTLNGFVLLTVLAGVLLMGGALMRMLLLEEPVDTPRLQLWLQNSELFWFFAVAAGLVAFVTTYLAPRIL